MNDRDEAARGGFPQLPKFWTGPIVPSDGGDAITPELYTAQQMREYVLADRANRLQAEGEAVALGPPTPTLSHMIDMLYEANHPSYKTFTDGVMEVIAFARNTHPAPVVTVDWTQRAFMRLGFIRDKMPPDEVRIVQDFITAALQVQP